MKKNIVLRKYFVGRFPHSVENIHNFWFKTIQKYNPNNMHAFQMNINKIMEKE